MCEISVTGGDIIVFLFCDDTEYQSDRLITMITGFVFYIHAQIPEC